MSKVRISVATPEADLAAVVWPGVTTIYHSRTESPDQIRAIAGRITELERHRGIRPGSVGIAPLVETPLGVSRAYEIASSSARIQGFGVGPTVGVGLEGDALSYARAQCELIARGLGLPMLDIQEVID